MSNTTEQKPEAKSNRVQVGNLPQQEKEVQNQEAESVKGGGAAMGGVDYRKGSNRSVQRPIGEEIPS